MLTFEITVNDHCRRVDSFLMNLLPSAQTSYLLKLLKSGHAKINNGLALPDKTLTLGDKVTLKESSKTAALLAAKKPELDILYEDSWIVVFNKPAGLPVHRTAETDELNLVEQGGRFLAMRGFVGKLRPVNRLDRGTSGAVILAKNAVAAAMFGKMIMADGLDKLYLALVSPRLPEQGIITTPLEGKEAETRYKLIFDCNEGSLAAITPISGRMHQIRLHFREIAHPIWGDKRYGGKSLSGFTGHALHSFRTTIIHPATQEQLSIYAPLPKQFSTLIRKLTAQNYEQIIRDMGGSQ
jgi:23S rRNA pseudouridine955/2504/2580 synthase